MNAQIFEWEFGDFHESICQDVVEHNGAYYFLLGSRENDMSNRIDVVRVEITADSFMTSRVYSEESQLGVARTLDYINGKWIMTAISNSGQSYELNCILLDSVFNDIGEAGVRVPDGTVDIYSLIRDDRVELVGRSGMYRDSLIYITVPVADFNSADGSVVRTDPVITDITAAVYDSLTSRYIVHHLSGLATMNDTFGLIERFSYPQVFSRVQGSICIDNHRYYCIGQSGGLDDDRPTLFHMYDTAFNILYTDTLGVGFDYCTSMQRQSVGVCNSTIFVGSLLDVDPLIHLVDRDRQFLLAKYKQEGDGIVKIWESVLGGEAPYYMYGIQPERATNGCFLFGVKRLEENDSRCAYIAYVDSSGNLTSLLPDPLLPEVDYTIVNPGGSDLRLELLSNSLHDVALHLFDMHGRRVLTSTLQNGWNVIDTDLLPAGAYAFQIFAGAQLLDTGVWIRQ